MVSDGFAYYEVYFVGAAAEALANGICKNGSIISVESVAFPIANVPNGKPSFEKIKCVYKNLEFNIGLPVSWEQFKANNFQNLNGRNQVLAPNEVALENLDRTVSHSPIVKALAGFGFSAVAGLCAAYFVKRIIRVVAFSVGGFFLMLQALAYKGLITIHWDNWIPNISLSTFIKFLTYGGAGFGVGFYFGIRNEIHKIFDQK